MAKVVRNSETSKNTSLFLFGVSYTSKNDGIICKNGKIELFLQRKTKDE